MEHLLLSCIESRIEDNRSLYSRFQLGPFNRGQGLTVANAIRRTLLSELSGLAIVCIEIQGVSHEYSNIKGVRESVLDILLNLKQVVFISDKKFNQPEIGFLKIQGPAIVKACDLKLPKFLHYVDPDQYIATLADNGILEIKFMVCEGKNFLVQTSFELIEQSFQSHFLLNKKQINDSTSKISHETFEDKIHENAINIGEPDLIPNVSKKIGCETTHDTDFQRFEKNLLTHKKKTTELQPFRNLSHKQLLKKETRTNVLFIDAVFMPIKKVNFLIQNIDEFSKPKDYTLEDKFRKNYLQEKIILEIWSNGSINTRDAITQATEQLIDVFIPFQKTYSHKKTKFFVQPVFSDKTIYSTSNELRVKYPSRVFYSPRKVLSNFNSIQSLDSSVYFNNKNSNLAPTLHTIYRPWQVELKNYCFSLKKRNKVLSSKVSFEVVKKFDIAYLSLSHTLYICLKRANIDTINDILQYSRNELLSLKNIKEKSVKQIENVLNKINLILCD